MNYLDSNQQNINPEVLHLIKTGGAPFLKDYMKELQQPDYPLDFVQFMDQMVKEKGIDRKTVIARSGLSESLAYKYLNGNKKTTERDYILAICIALHLNFPQTQHALRCCGLPLLGMFDPRALIIKLCIEQGLDRYKIDEYLENAGYPAIKVSSDMPSAEIKDSMYVAPDYMKMAESGNSSAPSFSNHENEEYTIIESSANAIHCGNAPFDFNYYGSMTLKDMENNTYHLEAVYLVTGECYFYVMNDKQYAIYKEREAAIDSMDFCGLTFPDDFENLSETEEEPEDAFPDPEFLESYESLLDATASPFFSYFLELDHLTDKKAADVMMDINDTRNYPFRIGSHVGGGRKPEIYIEMFNATQPECREYFQMIETVDHECTYTASHESYFMQIEIPDFYDVYFTKKREPEYFLKATDQDFSSLDKRYQMVFNYLRHYLHTFARSEASFVTIPDDQFVKEESEFFAEQFVTAMHAGNTDLAMHALQDQESILKSSNLPPARKFFLQLINDRRKYHVALFKKDQPEIDHLRKSIISKKKKALQLESELGEDASSTFSIIADILMDQWRSLQNQGDSVKANKHLKEILELTEHGAFADESSYYEDRFEFYEAYAFSIDGKEPEKAEEYYLKAIREATKHHLETQPRSAANVASTYNNYAWVLWNRLGSEEAIIYYGRAIELTESQLESGILTPEHARKNLAHYGSELIRIYEETSRQKEKERLIQRLLRSNVTPEE